jgi:hypothetical protein
MSFQEAYDPTSPQMAQVAPLDAPIAEVISNNTKKNMMGELYGSIIPALEDISHKMSPFIKSGAFTAVELKQILTPISHDVMIITKDALGENFQAFKSDAIPGVKRIGGMVSKELIRTVMSFVAEFIISGGVGAVLGDRYDHVQRTFADPKFHSMACGLESGVYDNGFIRFVGNGQPHPEIIHAMAQFQSANHWIPEDTMKKLSVGAALSADIQNYLDPSQKNITVGVNPEDLQKGMKRLRKVAKRNNSLDAGSRDTVAILSDAMDKRRKAMNLVDDDDDNSDDFVYGPLPPPAPPAKSVYDELDTYKEPKRWKRDMIANPPAVLKEKSFVPKTESEKEAKKFHDIVAKTMPEAELPPPSLQENTKNLLLGVLSSPKGEEVIKNMIEAATKEAGVTVKGDEAKAVVDEAVAKEVVKDLQVATNLQKLTKVPVNKKSLNDVLQSFKVFAKFGSKGAVGGADTFGKIATTGAATISGIGAAVAKQIAGLLSDPNVSKLVNTVVEQTTKEVGKIGTEVGKEVITQAFTPKKVSSFLASIRHPEHRVEVEGSFHAGMMDNKLYHQALGATHKDVHKVSAGPFQLHNFAGRGHVRAEQAIEAYRNEPMLHVAGMSTFMTKYMVHLHQLGMNSMVHDWLKLVESDGEASSAGKLVAQELAYQLKNVSDGTEVIKQITYGMTCLMVHILRLDNNDPIRGALYMEGSSVVSLAFNELKHMDVDPIYERDLEPTNDSTAQQLARSLILSSRLNEEGWMNLTSTWVCDFGGLFVFHVMRGLIAKTNRLTCISACFGIVNGLVHIGNPMDKVDGSLLSMYLSTRLPNHVAVMESMQTHSEMKLSLSGTAGKFLDRLRIHHSGEVFNGHGKKVNMKK